MEPMIETPQVFEEEFIPNEVVHRDGEIDHLTSTLQPLVHGEPADDSILYGPTGTGKTCIAKYAVERLLDEVPAIDRQYVNCWQDYSRFRVLYRLLEPYGTAHLVKRQSTPKDEVLNRVREAPEDPYVVILDEVDQLEDPAVLYDLYSIPEITMILVTNRDETIFTTVGDRIRSRLSGSARIHFDRYGQAELVSILEGRVEWGLSPGVVAPEKLEWIADVAAGDARMAIGILRSAARTAERRGGQTITSSDIEGAVPEAKDVIHQKSIEKLNGHQRKLYEIIDSDGPIAPGDLYATYRERIGTDPKTQRTIRNYLSKMEHYNLVESVGQTSDRVYQLPSHG